MTFITDATTSGFAERPRIEAFRKSLARKIPCFPDNPEVRGELEKLSLGDMLVVFTNWANRFVPPYPRTVSYFDNFWHDRKPVELAPAILEIADAVRSGHDLTPYLSDKIFSRGYVPAKYGVAGKRRGPDWGEKDFGLNAYDIHHLHLGRLTNPNEFVKHGRELLFIGFERENATFLFVGDHNSFDDGSLARKAAAWHGNGKVETPYTDKERQRLHRAGMSTFEVVNGKVLIGTELSTDGSSTVHWAMHLLRNLRTIDPLIDDKDWVGKFFCQHPDLAPSVPQFQWSMEFCDLVLLEETAKACARYAVWRRSSNPQADRDRSLSDSR